MQNPGCLQGSGGQVVDTPYSPTLNDLTDQQQAGQQVAGGSGHRPCIRPVGLVTRRWRWSDTYSANSGWRRSATPRPSRRRPTRTHDDRRAGEGPGGLSRQAEVSNGVIASVARKRRESGNLVVLPLVFRGRARSGRPSGRVLLRGGRSGRQPSGQPAPVRCLSLASRHPLPTHAQVWLIAVRQFS